MKKLYAAVGLAVLVSVLAFAPMVSRAAEFLAPGEQDNGNLTLPSSQTHRNLYVAGGNVTIDSVTTGDLYAAGGTVIVSGNIEQDANLGGGTVILNGNTGGDVRVFGGNITINRPVGGDVLVFGGTVTLGEQASIAGDLIVCGGSANVNGPVSGSVWASAGSVTLNSAITGPVKVKSGKQLVFGPNARVAGTVNYTGPSEALVQDGAQVSSIDFHMTEKRGTGHKFTGLFTLAFLLKMLAWIAAGLVLLQIFKRPARAVTESLRQSPWLNLGIGVLGAVVVPVLALILALVILGYYLAFLLFIAYIFFLGVSCITAAVFTGALIVKWLTKKPDLALDWQAVVIGVVLFGIVALVPVIGWIIVTLLSLMAFGAYVRLVRATVRSDNV